MTDLTPAPSFIVQHGNGACAWYLRGTTWANRDRAQVFDTPEAAREALAKARKFMSAATARAACIIAA